MPCGTVVGQELEFGISDDEVGLVTQAVSVVNKKDKKEARDKCGIVIAVAYYNHTSEISIEGLGTIGYAPGDSLSLSGTYLTLAGASFVEEVSMDKTNEDFVKVKIKAMSYEGIGA